MLSNLFYPRCIQNTYKVMPTRRHRIRAFLPCHIGHSPQRPPQNRTRLTLLRNVRFPISLCNIDRVHADRTIAEGLWFRRFFIPKGKKWVVVVGRDSAPLCRRSMKSLINALVIHTELGRKNDGPKESCRKRMVIWMTTQHGMIHHQSAQ